MLYYAYGNALLTTDEVFEPSIFEPLTGFFSDLEAGRTPRSVILPTGQLSADNVARGSIFVADAGPVPFQPIGPGLPLTLMINEVYTGKYPKGNFFRKTEDMLVTSAVKNIVALEAKPRALNMLKSEVTKRSRPGVAASERGAPIIFYSPALLEMSLSLDLTMAFNSFEREVFEQIGQALMEVANIPLFITQSSYLIAAGVITKLVGKIGETIFDRAPEFSSSDQLSIRLPGRPPLPAGYLLIISDDLGPGESEFRASHHVDALGKLVDDSGAEYNGDVPYIIISADGTPNEELKSFTPTAVSAAVMSRFFNIKDNQALPLDIVIDALKLYGDVKFRTEIDRLDQQIKDLLDGDPKKAELKKKRDALEANILEERLKPNK